MTILECCISLKMIKKILVVLGVVDMRQLLLKVKKAENFSLVHERTSECQKTSETDNLTFYESTFVGKEKSFHCDLLCLFVSNPINVQTYIHRAGPNFWAP